MVRAYAPATRFIASAVLWIHLLAFLSFNWSPAKVFMGDGTSGFLGFSFAALPLLVAEPTPADLWLKLNLGAHILFPFLFDGAFTLIRRAYFILSNSAHTDIHAQSDCDKTSSHEPGSRQSPIHNPQFAIRNLARLSELGNAHRSHLYQRWVQAGGSHRKVASAYSVWAALGAATALLVHFQDLSLLLAYPIVLIPAAALLFHSRRFPK